MLAPLGRAWSTRPWWLARIPPSGPRYDLWEVAVVVLAGAVLVYIVQSANSSAEAWLTAPGQRVAGYCMAAAAVVSTVLVNRVDRVLHTVMVLTVTCVFWSGTLTLGLVLDALHGNPLRFGSLFFVLLYAFLAQVARKAWGRHLHEQECRRW